MTSSHTNLISLTEYVVVSVTASPPAPKVGPPKGRDRYLDTLRAVAIIRVVTYHAFGFAWFPWFPAMGVMFALAGTLMVRSVDKGPLTAVKSRFRRLLPVVWAFGAIWIPLMVWHDGAPSQWGFGQDGESPIWQIVFWLVPVGDPPGSEWGETAWGVLWYLKTYLWFVALSPLLLKAFRKVPWLVMLMPFALLGLAEVGILPLEDWWGSTVNDVLVYLACWLAGFAHAEGIVKRLPLPALFAIGGAAVIAGLAWLAGPGNAQALEEGGRTWSVENSSITLALYSFGVVFILMRYSSRMEWLKRHRVIDRIITIFNSRAVTIYLWHNAAILLAMDFTDRIGLFSWFEWFPLTWVLIGVFVLMFGWIEDVAARRKPELLPGKQKVPAVQLQPGSSADAAPGRNGGAGAATTGPDQGSAAVPGREHPPVPGQRPGRAAAAPGYPGYPAPGHASAAATPTPYGGYEPQSYGSQAYGSQTYGSQSYGSQPYDNDPRYAGGPAPDPRYGDPRGHQPQPGPNDPRHRPAPRQYDSRPPGGQPPQGPQYGAPRQRADTRPQESYDDHRPGAPDQRSQRPVYGTPAEGAAQPPTFDDTGTIPRSRSGG